MCAINVRYEWNCSLPFFSCCWQSFSSTISHLFPSSSQWLFLPVRLMPAPVCRLLYCTTGLFKVLYCKEKKFYFCICSFLCIICVKNITNLWLYSTDCVSWVPRLTLLDVWTNWNLLVGRTVHIHGERITTDKLINIWSHISIFCT